MTPVVFAVGATHTGGGIGGVCRGVGAVVSCVRSEVFSGPARGGRFLGLLHDGLSILGVGGGLFAGSNGAVGESFPEKRLCRTIVVRQSNGWRIYTFRSILRDANLGRACSCMPNKTQRPPPV